MRLLLTLALCAFLPALSGCDTDNPSSPLQDLEGTYAFTELRFDPAAQAIADADVLPRLDSSDTYVQIRGTGRTLVFFQFDGEPSDLADVNAVASRSNVTFTAATEADAARLADLLLPSRFVLSRGTDDQRLEGQVSTTANLQAFDASLYQGLTAQPGTLYVTLDRVSGR